MLGLQLTALQLTVEGLEKERDFYFGKLRDIEVKCQEEDTGSTVVQKVLEILYATEVGAAFLEINRKHNGTYKLDLNQMESTRPILIDFL